jgi:Kef-type K+ transport system membrane component KefB
LEDGSGITIAVLGALLLLGMLGDLAARILPLPRVTLLVLFGVAIGGSGFDLLPERAVQWYPLIADAALLMVGFLLGGKLSRETFREVGASVLAISGCEVLGAALAVAGGLTLLGVDPAVALLLAGIAPATAPAAIQSVVSELGARGKTTDTLLGVVAIDDAWGLIVFSLLLAAAQALGAGGHGGSALDALAFGARDLGGALLIGLLVGVPAAYLTGRLRPGEPTQSEALGVVFLAGGLAIWAEVSYLLTAMLVGAVIVNLASHHDRPFSEIEHFEWPFMVLFFVLAGASLELSRLFDIGLIGLAYIALRAAGLVAGAYLGGTLAGAPARIRRWLGPAILPQAGVALGMALVAGNSFPALRDTILPLVVGSTIVFELGGPALTRLALIRAGEVPAGGPGDAR